MMLYSVTEGMTSGACSTRGQHVVVVSTNCAMCAGVEFNILVCVIVYEQDILAQSSVVQGWEFKGSEAISIREL